MPWKASDADRHKKGLTPAQKSAWAKIANSALKEYNGDEGRAIRTANAKAPKTGTTKAKQK